MNLAKQLLLTTNTEFVSNKQPFTIQGLYPSIIPLHLAENTQLTVSRLCFLNLEDILHHSSFL